MHPLDAYFARYFLNKPQLAEASGVALDELESLLRRQLVPAASYVVRDARASSAVFGTMSAPGATDGEYFHRDMVIWVRLAMDGEVLKDRFIANLRRALADLDRSTWRLRDSFRDDASVLEEGLAARCESMWHYFMNGTYGLCVARPVSEQSIARKELLQEKLIALTDNGSRTPATAAEREIVEGTIAAYAEACMPFSPLDYPLSSRKRLVDDFRTLLERS